jgi:hypothetical protein
MAALYVRYGSVADITARSRHVRFTPDSGHSSMQVGCPKSATSGHTAFETGHFRTGLFPMCWQELGAIDSLSSVVQETKSPGRNVVKSVG